MATRTSPPFRADHVGSLLRPARLLDARARRDELGPEGLRAVEDECIAEVARKQEEAGLQAITDGEFRRQMFHVDFLEQLRGVTATEGQMRRFHTASGEEVDFAPPLLKIDERVEHARSIEVENFSYLRSVTSRTPKVAIPSPTMLHFRGGRDAISRDAYPDLDQFFADLAKAYHDELQQLADAGCTYVQLDDTNLAYLCDPELREGARQRGDDPDDLTRRYAALINESIDGRPAEMSVAIHLCRGNFKSAWVAEGSYEAVAEILFNETNVDGFLLEYDDERSGDFAPLRFLPADKIVVLGLITSKTGALESKDDVKRRIDEAAQYAPLDQLCLSPQCGFSSSADGNALSEDEQWAKLRLVVDIAGEVWG